MFCIQASLPVNSGSIVFLVRTPRTARALFLVRSRLLWDDMLCTFARFFLGTGCVWWNAADAQWLETVRG
jgi:hypothetical protein